MLLYLLLFSSVLIWHIAFCTSFFLESAKFNSSFHYHASPLLPLPLFLSYKSSHEIKIPSLKCTQKNGTPTLTNLMTFSSINSWSSHLSTSISFFSQYMSFLKHSLFSSYLYLLPLMNVETPQGLPSHFEWTIRVLSLSTQSQFMSNFYPCWISLSSFPLY